MALAALFRGALVPNLGTRGVTMTSPQKKLRDQSNVRKMLKTGNILNGHFVQNVRHGATPMTKHFCLGIQSVCVSSFKWKNPLVLRTRPRRQHKDVKDNKDD